MLRRIEAGFGAPTLVTAGRRSMRIGALLALMFSPACPLPAQYLPPHLAAAPVTTTIVSDTVTYGENGGGAVLGAAVGGLAGLILLGHAGYYLGGGGEVCGDDPCGFAGAIFGMLLGEAVGVGLGAHLGNGRRGNALAPVGASLGVLLVAGFFGDQVPEGSVLFVPILQIAAAVVAETSIGRARAGGNRP